MRGQALRSAGNLVKSEAWKPWRPMANFFSTSPRRAADDSDRTAALGAAKPALEGVSSDVLKTPPNDRRKRAEAYVRQISRMLPDKSATTQQASLDQAATEKKLVLDVRSMPRAPRGLRPLGGPGPGGRFGAARMRGPPGRRRGAGLRGGRAKEATGKEGDAGAAGGRQQPQDIWNKMGPVARAFDEALRFGQPSKFEPPSTEALAAGLADLMPATPSSSAGRRATLLHSLARLAAPTTDAPGVARDLPPAVYAEELERGGLCFFADVETRDAVEAHLQEKRRDKAAAEAGSDAKISAPVRIINPPDESIRRAIIDGALEGRHETPRFATDPVGLARAWHLRSETYGPSQVDSFEKKLQSLLGKVGAHNGVGGTAHPAAQKAA